MTSYWNTPVFEDQLRRSRRSRMIVWTMVAVLTGWLVYQRTRPVSLHDSAAQAQPVAGRGQLLPAEEATIRIFNDAAPSVVYINTFGLTRSLLSLDLQRYPRGAGSGFVYNRDGYIVTNYHVVRDASDLIVTLADQTRWKARKVGQAPDKDLAVIKIDAPPDKLAPIPIGTSADLRVGQSVLAIGNPFGLDHTLTTGVVSALGREIESFEGRTIEEVIQTDAAINPGNSGGPLLDSAGRLIGVNTQITSPSGASAGIGFAVPVDTVSRIVPQLIRHGRVIRPSMGVRLLKDAYAKSWRLQGAIIGRVIEKSAAERAGLRGTVVARNGWQVRQLGDVITRVGDRDVRDTNDFLNALDQYEIGEEVIVEYQRDDKKSRVSVRLERESS